MMITRELPLDQPARFTTSWMTDAMFGVLWSGPAAFFVGQGGGDHDCAAVVRALEEILPEELVKVGGSSAACACTVREVVPDGVSSTWN